MTFFQVLRGIIPSINIQVYWIIIKEFVSKFIDTISPFSLLVWRACNHPLDVISAFERDLVSRELNDSKKELRWYAALEFNEVCGPVIPEMVTVGLHALGVNDENIIVGAVTWELAVEKIRA